MDDLKFHERRIKYESVVPIEVKNMVPREEYLSRLTDLERDNIANLFNSFNILFRNSISLMALAVGTTTYSEKYWNNLKKYLQENDPSKLGYVERKGEDIDIILCNDAPIELNHRNYSKYMDFAIKDLEKAGIDYLFEKGKRNSGSDYLTVPTEYKLIEGQGVIRYKSVEYSDALRISFPNSRDIHLYFDPKIGEIKLKYEIIQDNHFSLLFRHSARSDLIKLIEKINNK